jgi:hypothetical protein
MMLHAHNTTHCARDFHWLLFPFTILQDSVADATCSCRMFVHELVAAPAQTERMAIAAKIIKLLVKCVKEYNYALAAICCSVLTSTEGVPPPLEFAKSEFDGSSSQKLLPVSAEFHAAIRSLPDF